MEIEGRSSEIKKEVTYRWKLPPGKRFFIKENLHGDKEDWYPAEVEPGYRVIIGKGKLRTAKGGGKIGYGEIKEIRGDSFFSGEVFVSVGKEARVFFKKKPRFDQPKIPNFPKIPRDKK